ncbi:MAG: helix-turn-helix domain-containing protein [Nitrososphaeria archaeon]|nr:helix-turn-helix domain-containing protein [Nitrososphaeria archaeon]
MIGSNNEYISLQEFGLSEYESKVYTTLLKCGRMKIKDIALKSGVPRTKAYGVVKSLSEKGLVEFSGKEPLYCVPVPPEEVLSKRLEEEKKRFKKMVLVYKKLEELKNETKLPTDIEEKKYTVYSMRTFQKRLKEILENTSKSVYACLNWWGLNVLSEHIEKINMLSKEANVKIIVGLYNDDKVIERFDSTIDVRVTGKSINVNIILFDEKTTVLLEESGKITEINNMEVCKLAKEIIIEKFYKKSLLWKKAYQIIQLGGEDLITLYSGEEKVYEAFVQAVAETVFDEEKVYQIGEKFIENLTMMLQLDLFNKGFEIQQPIISALISENLGKDSTTRFDQLTRLYTLEAPMASKGLPATVWFFALAGAAKRSEMTFKILQNTSIQVEGKHIIQAKIEKKPLT